MSVKITDNTSKINSDKKHASAVALRLMLEDIDREAFARTPKRLGELRKDILKVVNGTTGSITWAVNYAVYQENKSYSHYSTAGTGAHFARNAVNAVVKRSDRYFKNGGL